MKKRVVATVLGIMLSMSMALEIPAAALEGDFESSFMSGEAVEEPQTESSVEEQPSESSVEEQPSESDSADSDGFSDGFVSEDIAGETGSTDPVQNFE